MAETRSGIPTHKASDWRALIGEAVAAIWPDLTSGVDWIEAQVHVESLGDPAAESRAGAQGLLQLMPATAADLGITNAFDPKLNLLGGISYLKRQFERLGEIPDDLQRLLWAFAAYNGGRGYIDFNGGPLNTCLELAQRDAPNDWWRWDVGRRWLPDVVLRGKTPDYNQITSYVARIRARAALLGALVR